MCESVIGGNFFRRAGADDPAAAGASFGPEIDEPIGRFDDIEIMLDHEHRVARVGEIVQHLQQHLDVGEVQPGGRLVQQIERAAGAFLDQLAGQLDPLGFAAGKRRRRLAEFEIIEADVVQRLQLVPHVGNVFEMLERLLDIHLQHFGDVLAL